MSPGVEMSRHNGFDRLHKREEISAVALDHVITDAERSAEISVIYDKSRSKHGKERTEFYI